MDRRSLSGRWGRGFTIIELVLALALIGILATIAVQSYAKYVERTRTAEAVVDVSVMSTTIEQYWQENHAYPTSLADVGYAGSKDPWGRPYIYYNVDDKGRGGARKDHALNPLNTDFDLYSKGPDGKTKPQVTQKDSLDDIVRAGNGAFVGVAADF